MSDTCPGCRGPITYSDDGSGGITVNFHCPNPTCPYGKHESEPRMIHVTVTLNPAASGLPNNPELPGPNFEFEVEAGQDDEDTCETVFAICNSYPEEMFCGHGYAGIVERYRDQRLRSLSVGDSVALTSEGTTRRYTVASFGFTADPA